MSSWDERFENHPAQTSLTQLEQLLAAIKSVVETEAVALEQFDRINRFTTYARKKFDSADAQLVSPAPLNNFHAAFQSIITEISAYQSNRNPGHLVNANTYVDSVLANFSGLHAPRTENDFTDFREAASSYRKSVSQLARNLQEEVAQVKRGNDALLAKFDEFTKEISAQKTRLDTAIATFQQQFSTAQETRQSDYSATQTKYHELFMQAEETRQTDFDTFLSDSETSFKDTESKFLAQSEIIFSDIHTKSHDLILQIEASRDHANKLVGIISETGMVHGYQSTANEERKASKLWKFVAVISLSLWVILACVFFFLTYTQELSWTAVVRQIFISTPFILLAGFSAMQVSQHQRVERANRRAELEIASIEPFLATLDDDERNDVKRSLVDKFFGQQENDNQKSESKRMLSLMVDLAKIIQQLQTSIRK